MKKSMIYVNLADALKGLELYKRCANYLILM